MKARLLQTLFTAQVIFCSTFILAAESNKDIRALQEQNIMSVLFQQTSAEGLASSLQTYESSSTSFRSGASRSNLERIARANKVSK